MVVFRAVVVEVCLITVDGDQVVEVNASRLQGAE